MSAQTHGHRHSHVHVHADQHSRTQIKHSCRSFPLTYRFCWSYNTANFFWSQSKPYQFHQVYHFFQISISARQKFKHFVPLTPRLGRPVSPEPADPHAQAPPFAAGASAAQSSAASGCQNSSHSLFSPKPYQKKEKDAWRGSVFSPAVFDNALPCGIITVL